MLSSLIKKRINFNFSQEKMILDTSDELFSSAQVDLGTKALLNSLRKNDKISYDKVLDLGCGTGIIGLFIKKKHPDSNVLCTDRDSIALDFAKHNADLNGLTIGVLGSVDYEFVEEKFDLIVTNFPAKLQEKGLNKFVLDASNYLNPDGVLALVVVKELRNALLKIVESNEINLLFSENLIGYSVYHLNFARRILMSEEPYKKSELKFSVKNKLFVLESAESIPEFDNLHHKTLCLIKVLEGLEQELESVTVVNPWQGALGIFVEEILEPKEMNVFSRDLLSLKYAKRNLEMYDFTNFHLFHEDYPKNSDTPIIWNVCDSSFDLFFEKFNLLKKSMLLLSAKKSFISRLKTKGFKFVEIASIGGYVGVIWDPRKSL
jgi:16S rRNA (guanine1207-N2)-methyltransferase